MKQQGKIGNGKDPKYCTTAKGSYGKEIYLYEEPGKSVIMLESDEVQEFQQYRHQEIFMKKQSDPRLQINIPPSKPRNLTKEQKKIEEKIKKDANRGGQKPMPATYIASDINPSQIYEGVASSFCFGCCDKDTQISKLKERLEITQKKYQISALIQNENQRLRKQLKQIKEKMKPFDFLKIQNEVMKEKLAKYNKIEQISADQQYKLRNSHRQLKQMAQIKKNLQRKLSQLLKQNQNLNEDIARLKEESVPVTLSKFSTKSSSNPEAIEIPTSISLSRISVTSFDYKQQAKVQDRFSFQEEKDQFKTKYIVHSEIFPESNEEQIKSQGCKKLRQR